MPGSCAIEAEPGLQHLFSILEFAVAVLLAATVVNFGELTRYIPNRAEHPPRVVPIRFDRVSLPPTGFAPLKLAGAWRLTAPDPRFGGASALAVTGDSLLALSDSGVLFQFPKPGTPHSTVLIKELPAGPGPSNFKRNRDSESLLRDWQGRGWWAGFENRNRVWMFDRDFRAVGNRLKIGRGWPRTGFEAMVHDGNALLLVPESGGKLLAVNLTSGEAHWRALPPGTVSDAATLPDGTLLLVQRALDLRGLHNRLVHVRRDGTGYALIRAIPLGVERRDNVEGLAIEARAGRVLRLWLITDDGRKAWPQRTLLLALDWPATMADGNSG